MTTLDHMERVAAKIATLPRYIADPEGELLEREAVWGVITEALHAAMEEREQTGAALPEAAHGV